ncbi:PUL domain [Arabidopsis thaliana x Arabidopsis arenosa]|uniref:PUL domain n=1 Tax=Arabidopsis thaliana x Arabidopsis arenosa TaxID=1240361 RepID=A0A8T1XLF4_9BRAS|nr:PUL domain [Arabidopsis thaliana x Arabidopsis arenosa]KAG7533399.1 PUL domain [Arabidopsis thaliana x Arabidopsis arenosa]
MFTWISLKIVSLKALIGLDFIFQSDLLLDLIKKVTEDSALPANLLTTVRVMVNLFKNSSFHYWLQTHHSQILDVF